MKAGMPNARNAMPQASAARRRYKERSRRGWLDHLVDLEVVVWSNDYGYCDVQPLFSNTSGRLTLEGGEGMARAEKDGRLLLWEAGEVEEVARGPASGARPVKRLLYWAAEEAAAKAVSDLHDLVEPERG